MRMHACRKEANMSTETELTLYKALDEELLQMVECFRSCVAASATEEEPDQQASISKERKPTGDLVEVRSLHACSACTIRDACMQTQVWAEKLIYSGFSSLHLLSQVWNAMDAMESS